MANQVTIQFQADRRLSEDCAEIFQSRGMDLNTALRMFLERTRKAGTLPFTADPPAKRVTREEALEAFQELRRQAADTPEMTLEEINAEISAARIERERRG